MSPGPPPTRNQHERCPVGPNSVTAQNDTSSFESKGAGYSVGGIPNAEIRNALKFKSSPKSICGHITKP